MTAIALFASTFALVFLLGMQSLVVQADMRRIAFANAKVSGAGTASAGLPGYTAGDDTE